jgi:hypothetical protein
VIPIVIVAVGLRLTNTGTGAEGAALFIFAGYSIDSVVGTLLTRFDLVAPKGLAVLG